MRVISRFGFESWVWFLIVPVPFHCLLVTFFVIIYFSLLTCYFLCHHLLKQTSQKNNFCLKVLKRFMNASWEDEEPSEKGKITEAYIDTMYGLFVASFSLGAIVGSSSAGFMANKFGR